MDTRTVIITLAAILAAHATFLILAHYGIVHTDTHGHIGLGS